MNIKILKEDFSIARQWDEYVLKNPLGTNDHLWNWRDILSQAFGFKSHYLAAIEEGRLVGVLPLFQIPVGWRNSALTSIPYGNYGGILADTPEIEECLLDAAINILDSTHGKYLELRHRRSLSLSALVRPSQRTHNRFYLPLLTDSNLHLKAIGRNVRQQIRQSERSGLQIKNVVDVQTFYKIHTHTCQRLGSPCFPRRYFELILEKFKGKARILGAHFNGKVIASHFFIYFKNEIVCQFSASYSDFFKFHPNEFLFWKSLQISCSEGFRVLDHCRSKIGSGNADFKKKFGFLEELLNYQYYLPRGGVPPFRSPANPKYQFAIQLWRRLPRPLINKLGPGLVRYFA